MGKKGKRITSIGEKLKVGTYFMHYVHTSNQEAAIYYWILYC